MMGSPQAVFTSFKLPKPNSGDLHHLPPMPSSPFARFPSMPFQASATTPSSASSTPRVLSAPLGGLPAVDSQVAARQQQQQQQQQHQPQQLHQQPARHLRTPERNSDDEDDDDVVDDTTPTKKRRLSEVESRHDRGSSDESPPKAQGLIKARGTYYPLTAFPTTMPQGPVMHRDGSPPRTESQPSKNSFGSS
jgi:hypothetical protein